VRRRGLTALLILRRDEVAGGHAQQHHGAQRRGHFGKVFNYPALESPGLLELSLFTSLLFTVGVLALGVRRFARLEY
jgi:hypothetical protein